MTSPPVIQDMIRRGQSPLPRIAVVADVINGPPLTVLVRFVEGGGTFAPAIVNQSVQVKIGDKCLIAPTGTQWVLVGTINDPDPRTMYQVMEVDLKNNWLKLRNVDTGEWFHQYDRVTSAYPESRGSIEQGRWEFQGGGQGGVAPMPLEDHVTVMSHRLPQVLEVLGLMGGTVEMVELVMTRGDGATPVYASPRMFGHRYDRDSPPVANQAPQWVPGFGPIDLSPFARGQTVRWVIPAAWVTAAATGEILGFGFDSRTTTNRFMSYAPVTGSTKGGEWNAKLVVTLTAPVDITGGGA